MTVRTEQWQHPEVKKWVFKLRIWECCGLEWQLLLSKRWPTRESWNPTCPKCGETSMGEYTMDVPH